MNAATTTRAARPALTSRAPPRRSAAEQGTTFAELMLATLIIGTTVVGATSSLTQSATVYHYFTDGPHEALMLAQEIHEAALQLPWEAEEGAPPAFGNEVVTFWDLDEQSFSPPRSANYEVVVSHPYWKQDVAIDYVDLEHPTVVVEPDTFGGEMLVRLQVTIFNGTLQAGVFNWWMTEPETGS